MSQALHAAATLDLSSCDHEPIRIPGSIQPHGFLLCLSHGLEVLQASDNLARMSGVEALQAIGKPLEAVVGAAVCELLTPYLHGESMASRPAYLGSAALSNGP